MRRRLRFSRPIDLALTLGPLRHGRDPTIRLARKLALRATRTPHGPAAQRIEINGGDAVVEAWGPGREWLLDHAPTLLGLTDDDGDFDPPDPVVKELHRRLPGLRIGRSDAVIEALIPTVLEQKVTGKAAKESYRRLVWIYGESAPGPLELRLPPAPEIVAELPYYELHRLGVERRRARTISYACSYAHRLEETVTMSLGDAYKRMRALPGVGAWTAGLVAHIALGDPDAVVLGDFHLPHIVSWTLAGEPRGSDERMLELLAPFEGHRGRVMRLIESGGARPPAYGPRQRITSIAAI